MLNIDGAFALELCITAQSKLNEYPRTNEGLVAVSLFFESLHKLSMSLKVLCRSFDGNTWSALNSNIAPVTDSSKYADILVSKLISADLIRIIFSNFLPDFLKTIFLKHTLLFFLAFSILNLYFHFFSLSIKVF